MWWWGCSAWNAISSKALLRQQGGASCVSAISLASNVPGLFMMPFLFMVQARYQFYQYLKLPSRWQLLSLAFTHSVGLHAAYKGLVEGKVSFVQTMKAIEPLIAVCFSALFFKNIPQFDSIIAMAVITAGVFLVCVEDLSVSASSWILISSFMTQGRNQLLKICQKEDIIIRCFGTGIRRYLVISKVRQRATTGPTHIM